MYSQSSLANTIFVPKERPRKEDLGKQDMSDQDFYHYLMMVEEPLCSSDVEMVRMVAILGKGMEKLPDFCEYNVIQVSDEMTTQQLLVKWYKAFTGEVSKSSIKTQYLVVHRQGGKKKCMQVEDTVMNFKHQIGVKKLSQSTYFFVYVEKYCRNHQEESGMTGQDHSKFQEKNKKITIPIKVNLNEQTRYYFQIESFNFYMTIAALKDDIKKALTNGSQDLIFGQEVDFGLFIEKSPRQMKKVQETLKNLKFDSNALIAGSRLNLQPSLFKVSVRRLCYPGQIVQLNFTHSYKYDRKVYKGFVDYEIRIKTYQADMVRRVIVRKFSEVLNIKVSTLLEDQKIDEPLTTCLCFNKAIFRPMQKFKEIPQIISKAMNNGLILEFTCVSDNLVFYLELGYLSRIFAHINIDQLLQQIRFNNSLAIEHTAIDKFREQMEQKRNSLSTNQEVKNQHKSNNFFGPIMLYTAQLIYCQLNSNLRQTSISLFQYQQVINQCWHLKISEKILSSLIQLPSLKENILYRGTGNFPCTFKLGQIVEFSSFTSTSLKLEQGLKFTRGSYPTLFQITTFTGKPVWHFSKFIGEQEVLIKPCTKFKVLDVFEIQNQYNKIKIPRKCKVFKLLQLPAPTMIQGNLIVWVHHDLQKCQNDYNKIIKDLRVQRFELIQLRSNQHFKDWLKAYRHLLDMPHVKIRFITNMNRSEERKREGIETLRMIRQLNKNTPVIFFVRDPEEKMIDLANNGWGWDQKILVKEKFYQMEQIFRSWRPRPKIF